MILSESVNKLANKIKANSLFWERGIFLLLSILLYKIGSLSKGSLDKIYKDFFDACDSIIKFDLTEKDKELLENKNTIKEISDILDIKKRIVLKEKITKPHKNRKKPVLKYKKEWYYPYGIIDKGISLNSPKFYESAMKTFMNIINSPIPETIVQTDIEYQNYQSFKSIKQQRWEELIYSIAMDQIKLHETLYKNKLELNSEMLTLLFDRFGFLIEMHEQ